MAVEEDIVDGRSKTMGASSIRGVSEQSRNVSSSNESAGSTESRTESIARCARMARGNVYNAVIG